MSSDLWAAFGSNEASVSANNTSAITTATATSENNKVNQTDEQPWILQSRSVPKPQRGLQDKPLWCQDSRGNHVLFDASDDDQAEDDFGDFEAAPIVGESKTTTAIQQSQDASIDLLGLESFPGIHTTRPQNISSTSPILWNAANGTNDTRLASQNGPKEHRPSPPRAGNLWDRHDLSSKADSQAESDLQKDRLEDDDWGNFEDVEAEENHSASKINTMPTTAQTTLTKKIEQPSTDNDDWDTFEDLPSTLTQPTHCQEPIPEPISAQTTAPSQTVLKPRPTNIPPPSYLLQLLPQVYHQLNKQSQLQITTSSLASHILEIYSTSARLIAGRPYRWKRDTHLSQSTRISQAGLKTTGMKLTALDKSETIKEDQDVQEAISAWLRQAAGLNAVMLKAKVQKPHMSLTTNMTVRTMTGPGVLTARECCAVCGLKRNERVVGIDVKVEDTFGEFWVEHWGHKDCYDFWYTHEGLLNKR